MTTRCTVCNHPDLDQIHKAQAAGNSHAKLADLFPPLSAPALQRHFSKPHGIQSWQQRAARVLTTYKPPSQKALTSKTAHKLKRWRGTSRTKN